MLEETIGENYETTKEEFEHYIKWLLAHTRNFVLGHTCDDECLVQKKEEIEYAKRLGMDLVDDAHLFWIAR